MGGGGGGGGGRDPFEKGLPSPSPNPSLIPLKRLYAGGSLYLYEA